MSEVQAARAGITKVPKENTASNVYMNKKAQGGRVREKQEMRLYYR